MITTQTDDHHTNRWPSHKQTVVTQTDDHHTEVVLRVAQPVLPDLF